MMNYSDDPTYVRVDFFKETGKWYTTEAIKWLDYDGELYKTFARSLASALSGRLSGMWAVCLDPYSSGAFPLMIKVE